MRKLIIREQKQQAQYYSEDLGNGIELDMTFIPEGSFLMGTPEPEISRLCQEYDEDYFRAEGSQHWVQVSALFMGKYPVTQSQWRMIADDNSLKVDINLDSDPSSFKEPYQGQDRWIRPVEKISWHAAKEFCARLRKKTNRNYRLPTEAEWEYACRAETTTAFHFGKTIKTDLANYRGKDRTDSKGKVISGNYGNGPKGIAREETTPVGYFKVANAFGLYDMHGNVWEWCEDDWHEDYEGAPTDGSAWVSNKSEERIVRGGSWYNPPIYCRSAYRGYYSPDDGLSRFGLRVVCAVPRT